jgi:F-type H+-transporting ATPase subunit b
MTSTFLNVASSSGYPLIDIDGTAYVQFGLFLATMAIATQFLIRPYLAMRDRRSAGIEGAQAEAVRMSAEAEAKLASYESQLAVARTRANEERRRVRSEAAAHQRDVTEQARAEATVTLDAAKARVAAETATARATLMPRASELAGAIASRLLGRKVA